MTLNMNSPGLLWMRGGLLLFLATQLIACAGPTTPFGAIHSLLFVKKVQPVEKLASTNAVSPLARIEFYPERQLFHSSTEFKVKITDPEGIPKDAKIKVYYGDYDVSETFLNSALHIVNRNKTELSLEYDHLRLLAGKPNSIRFTYQRNKESSWVTADYLAPYCTLDEKNSIQTLGSFQPPKYILKYIEHWSLFHNVNPTLLAGLVAQESSFDTQAISWAKAVGLTQMTRLADLDIAELNDEYKTWPRSKNIERYSAAVVKTMILAGKITSEEDYRLDPEKSVRGGLVYLKSLEDYWRKDTNYLILKNNFNDPEAVITEIMLASYNSGASRVKNAINNYGVDYLKAANLQEAQKYVRNINSYCYHFAQESEEVNP